MRGFLSVPGLQFTADPDGGFVQDGNTYHSTARPHLNGGGAGAGAYDWPLLRWLPVELRNVSPDGAHYAYQNSSGIHDVEVATGKDRTLAGSSGVDAVLYYATEGIYFNHGAWEGPPGPGLWLLDPATGKVQTVFTDKRVDTVGGFAAWLPWVNPADSHPLQSSYSGGPLPNQADRRDLNGGATVPWFYQPGKFVTVVGFDQDRRALINVSSGESVPGINEIWLVPTANQGTRIFTGPELPRIVGDSHGTWLSDRRGIWLYTFAQGLVHVSPIVADVAGRCQ